MNTEKVLKALDSFSEGINILKESLSENSSKTSTIENSINTELLAKRLAYSYTTYHPEYKVESQIKNLKDMVNGQKISFVLKWLKNKNIEGIEEFFKLDVENQRVELNKALEMFENEIREVFNKRFHS